MKNPLLLLLALVVVALMIAGFVFLSHASSPTGFIKESRQPALISGMTCLGLGTGLLVLGIFQFRKRD